MYGIKVIISYIIYVNNMALIRCSVYRIDSFTSVAGLGASTVAIASQSILSDEKMKLLAKKFDVPETSFIMESISPDFKFKVRVFTATGIEVPFCGIATTGALAMIADKNLYFSRLTFSIEVGTGILPVEIKDNKYSLFIDKVKLRPEFNYIALEACDFDMSLINTNHHIQRETVFNYLIFAVKSFESLKQLKPSMDKIKEFCRRFGFDICPMIVENSVLYTRSFAPLCGIDEDPMTVSAIIGLIKYGLNTGMILTTQRYLKVEQGHCINRKSEADVEILSINPLSIKVTGTVVYISKTEIEI